MKIFVIRVIALDEAVDSMEVELRIRSTKYKRIMYTKDKLGNKENTLSLQTFIRK